MSLQCVKLCVGFWEHSDDYKLVSVPREPVAKWKSRQGRRWSHLTLQVRWVITHPLAGVVLLTGQPDALGVQKFQTNLSRVHCLCF